MGCSRLMISNSIAINSASLLLLALFTLGCKDSDAAKLKGEGVSKATFTDTLYSRCTTNACSLFTIGKRGKEIFIDEGSRATTVRRVGQHLFRATSSCGSPCSGALYYDTKTGNKSGFYSDMIAEDTANLLVAHMDGPTIIARCIFQCVMEEKKFSPPLGPSAAPRSAIQEAHFEKGRLILHYLRGQEFESAVDTFLVKNP